MNFNLKKSIINFGITLLVIIIINLIGSKIYHRFDLTQEKRYTLTQSTKNLLKNNKEKVDIEVYLDGKNLPAGFKQLKNETKELLQEFRNISKGNIQYHFIDIDKAKNQEAKEKLQNDLIEKGILPVNLEVKTSSGTVEKLIFPGAIIKTNKREIPVQILENQFAFGAQGALNNSVNFLEYKVANGIQKALKENPPRIAFLQGHDELDINHLQDFIRTLGRQNFIIDRVFLDKDDLLNSKTDVLVIAKPQLTIPDNEKFIIDQFIMNGGKVLWLIDNTTADLSRFELAPNFVASNLDLGITDLLFRYGVRINYNLVLDLYCTQIPIIETIGGNPQPKLFPWVFYPIAVPNNRHAIVKNLDPIWFRFCSSIDTLAIPDVKKTILATTSQYARVQNTPFDIYLQGAKLQPNPELFNKKDIPLAVLLEGNFKSLYKNQLTTDLRAILANFSKPYKSSSNFNKMIVVADGDVIKNDLDSKGVPVALGYDRYTQKQFANKDFLLNSIEYLIDDNNLIEARNREIKMRLIDKAKLEDKKALWQFITIIFPLLFTLIVGGYINRRRIKKYQ
ncbi:MAG: gliding motility-associated ABC transporter substrate-binding protein GldG [Chitinophagales bacterium]